MIKNFNFAVPGLVSFGAGCINSLGDRLKAKNMNRALLISDRGLEKAGVVQTVEDILTKAGITYEKFLDVEPNPSSETVLKAAEVFKANKLETIICLGGGSPMDTGKAAAVMATNPGNPEDYAGGIDLFKNPIPPIVAIPTTAGTGSENTIFAVITNRKTNFKYSIVSGKLTPSIILLDPELITKLPPIVAASTGMDALTHAVESYISRGATPFSDAMGQKAMEYIGRYLRRFVADRSDIEAASGMMLGSNFAGIAFSWGYLGMAHAMAHPLGGYYNVPHGIANAILLPHALKFNAIADKDNRYLTIYEYIRASDGDIGYFEPSMLVEEVVDLAKSIGIPESLSKVGVDETHIPAMAIDAMKGSQVSSWRMNPRTSTAADIEQLYRDALKPIEL